MKVRIFYTYILTNWERTVLYTGVTNNLAVRLIQHYMGSNNSFTSKYKVYYLVWYETSKYVLNAIAREKEIKELIRQKKNALITEFNPGWKFLNEEILGNWPPTRDQMNEVMDQFR